MQRHIPVAEDSCSFHNLERKADRTELETVPKLRMADCAAGLDRSRAVMSHSTAVDHVDGLFHKMPLLGLVKDHAFAMNWSAY